jgi:diacylglycerol kinase (ATP)
MKTRFIFNPCSGHNRRRPGLVAVIRDFMASRSLEANVAVTEGAGHATELARAAVHDGHDLVVAVGGDGTMNEVAQGLVDTPAALGLLPCGSGNGLARHLGIPRSVSGALRLVSGIDARIGFVDTGKANGHTFCNAMGLGLDAAVSWRFNRLKSRGLSGYARVAWATLRELPSETCVISSVGRRETLDVLLIAIANSDQYGNNARIAPGARVDDGRLDLVAIKAIGLAHAAMLVPRLFLGNLDASPHVSRICGSRFLIERAAPGLIHTDGETHLTGARIEVIVLPGSLRVLVPRASLAVPSTTLDERRFALQLP